VSGAILRSGCIGPGRRSKAALLATAALLGWGLLFLVPSGGVPGLTCAFKEWTGLSCLTCGLTRSLREAAHGDLMAAFRYHLMGVPILGGMALGFLFWVGEAFSGKRLLLPGSMKTRLLTGFAAVWILFWCIRLTLELLRITS
jgi:hypothetical protein